MKTDQNHIPRRMLALTLAGVVFTGIAAERDFAEGLTAQQILDKMATIYATCKSYRDSGVVTNDFGPHSAGDNFPRHVAVKPFRTAFVRPDQFRFEYDDATPEKPYVVWAKGSDVCTWWYIKPGVGTPASLENAIAGATGVSSGSAHTVPTLLLPDQIGGRKLTAMTDLKRLPDETLDATPCFKLQGKYANAPTTIWLGKATHLILRTYVDTGLVKCTTVYKPQVDIEIPAKELEFNPPQTR
jgi:outer membrane lipoprotein-sorting protein